MSSTPLPLNIIIWQPAAARRKFGLERIAELCRGHNVWLNPLETGHPMHETAATALAQADVLVTGWGCQPLSAELYALAPRLRLVCLLGSSVKPANPETAWARQIVVTNTAVAIAEGVTEYVLGAVLLWLHKLDHYDRGMKAGDDWHGLKARWVQRNLCDTVVGLVGCGLVGARFGACLRQLGARVRVYDPYLPAAKLAESGFEAVASLDELLGGCDILSLHAGVNADTEKMIGARELSLLRDGSLFVNTARAALVDETALVAELRTGRIDAFLDVFETEPLPRESPLLSLPNVLLAPHAAASSSRTVHRRMVEIVGDNIQRLARNEPPVSVVTREMYRLMT